MHLFPVGCVSEYHLEKLNMVTHIDKIYGFTFPDALTYIQLSYMPTALLFCVVLYLYMTGAHTKSSFHIAESSRHFRQLQTRRDCEDLTFISFLRTSIAVVAISFE